MGDHVEEQENHDFSLSPCPNDSDTEVVLRREIFDSCLNPEDDIKGESVKKFDHDFENWKWKPTSLENNTFDLDKDSHIENIVDKSNTDGNEKCVRNENLESTGSVVLDSKVIIQNEPLYSKSLEPQVADKSPEMEFRHRYSNSDRLSSRDEESRVVQSIDHSSEAIEPKAKSYKKVEEDPLIREEASEVKFHENVKSK